MGRMRAPDYFDRRDRDDEDEDGSPRTAICHRCGSTEVRWRQQGGRWTLFSLQPGVLHVCPINDPFEVVPE